MIFYGQMMTPHKMGQAVLQVGSVQSEVSIAHKFSSVTEQSIFSHKVPAYGRIHSHLFVARLNGALFWHFSATPVVTCAVDNGIVTEVGFVISAAAVVWRLAVTCTVEGKAVVTGIVGSNPPQVPQVFGHFYNKNI
jgi:hypothetical protein